MGQSPNVTLKRISARKGELYQKKKSEADHSMLFVLIGLLLVASVFVLLMKKNRESLCLLGMCCSLMVQFSGILIFIAKKGG